MSEISIQYFRILMLLFSRTNMVAMTSTKMQRHRHQHHRRRPKRQQHPDRRK